jgi:alpha-L-rhamnosidase
MKFTTLLIASVSLVTLAPAQAMRANHLRCEYLENPIGIGETSPRLSWWCDSRVRGDKQTAYQILVASSPQKLNDNKPDLWNSGKTLSSESTQIAYSGD